MIVLDPGRKLSLAYLTIKWYFHFSWHPSIEYNMHNVDAFWHQEMVLYCMESQHQPYYYEIGFIKHVKIVFCCVDMSILSFREL
jgi:hypothetical protein